MGYSIPGDFEEENTTSLGVNCCFIDNSNKSLKDYVHCEDIKRNFSTHTSNIILNLNILLLFSFIF